MPQFICPTCNEAFVTVEPFRDHILHGASDDCSHRKRVPHDGVDDAKQKQLKTRQNGRTERQKWEWMYRILFPDDDIIPTPCKQPPPLPAP